MANFSFLTIAHTSFFLLVKIHVFIAKNHQRVVFSSWMLLKAVLGVCSIRIFAKNMGDPYMNPLSWFMISHTQHNWIRLSTIKGYDF